MMRSAFLINCLAAVFGMHACISILEHSVEPSVISNSSSAKLTCRVDAESPNVEVWWTFKGDNASNLPNIDIGRHNVDKGEWHLQLKCFTSEHEGAYICNAKGLKENEAVSSQELILKIYVPPEVSWVHTLAATNESLLFGWRMPTNDNGARITHYNMQLQSENGSLLLQKTMAINSPGKKNHMYLFVCLVPTETYIFQVSACSVLGCSKWSEPLKAKTADGVPDPPMNVLLTCDHDFQSETDLVTVTWDPPANARGTILGYNVTRFTRVEYVNKNNQTVEDRTSKTDIIDAGKHKMEYTTVFLPNTEMNVTMCTINNSGCGPMTNITVNTHCKSPSDGCEAILEHIVEPPIVNICSPVKLICRVDNSKSNMEVWWTFKGENVSQLSYATIVTDNSREGEWQLQLKCPTPKHKGTYICNTQARSGKKKACLKKAILKIFEAPVVEFTNESMVEDPNTVNLHWQVKDDGNVPVTRFLLHRYSSVDEKPVEVDKFLGNTTQYTTNDLLPGLSYSFKLAAFNEVGEGKAVHWNVTMPVPLKVSVVKVFFPTNKSLIFGWHAPSYDNGVDITHYNMRLLQSNGSLVDEKTAIFSPHQFENLQPGKTYTFQVQACDNFGCGVWSDPIEGRTTEG